VTRDHNLSDVLSTTNVRQGSWHIIETIGDDGIDGFDVLCLDQIEDFVEERLNQGVLDVFRIGQINSAE
jgi:hypothetical protein